MKIVTLLLFFLVSTYASKFPTKQELANTGDLPRVTMLISNISKEVEGYLRGGNGNIMPDELFKTLVVTDEFKQMIQSSKRDNRLDPFAFGFKSFDRLIKNDSLSAYVNEKRSISVPDWVKPDTLKEYTYIKKFRLSTWRTWLVENWYETKGAFLDSALSVAQLGAAIADLMHDSAGETCRGYIQFVEAGGLKWQCAVSAWTNENKDECYTDGTASMFANPCDEAIEEANKREMAAYCLTGWNGGTFHADARVFHPDVRNANIWDLDCNN